MACVERTESISMPYQGRSQGVGFSLAYPSRIQHLFAKAIASDGGACFEGSGQIEDFSARYEVIAGSEWLVWSGTVPSSVSSTCALRSGKLLGPCPRRPTS